MANIYLSTTDISTGLNYVTTARITTDASVDIVDTGAKAALAKRTSGQQAVVLYTDPDGAGIVITKTGSSTNAEDPSKVDHLFSVLLPAAETIKLLSNPADGKSTLVDDSVTFIINLETTTQGYVEYWSETPLKVRQTALR